MYTLYEDSEWMNLVNIKEQLNFLNWHYEITASSEVVSLQIKNDPMLIEQKGTYIGPCLFICALCLFTQERSDYLHMQSS